MKHSLEERMDIGRRMYLHEITYKEAKEIYGLSESCAHKYMTDYKKAQGIPLANTVPKMKNSAVLKYCTPCLHQLLSLRILFLPLIHSL